MASTCAGLAERRANAPRRPQLAKLTLARKIAATSLAMWKQQSVDCDDHNVAMSPGVVEICNGIDDDCNDLIDDEDPAVVADATFYRDADGDGWGEYAGAVVRGTRPDGYVLQPGDCNDDDPAVRPNAAEICNRVDDNYDGIIDADDREYAIVAWNTLGMHCGNPSFADLAVLPPYNTLWAQVIQLGDPSSIVTSGITLEYSFADNTFSADSPPSHDKTDF